MILKINAKKLFYVTRFMLERYLKSNGWEAESLPDRQYVLFSLKEQNEPTIKILIPIDKTEIHEKSIYQAIRTLSRLYDKTEEEIVWEIQQSVPEVGSRPDDCVPRRNRLDRMCPAEVAITNAMYSVEEMESDRRLTRAVILLAEARECVADFIDHKPPETRMVSLIEMLEMAKVGTSRRVNRDWSDGHDAGLDFAIELLKKQSMED